MMTATSMTSNLMTSEVMTSEMMTSEMMTCRPRRREGMMRPRAVTRRWDGRAMKAMSAPSGSVGFTLVEMLVVIGVIAVLIAILLPVLSKARAQANRTVCLSNIRQLGTAILMYCNDNDGWFPTCAFWESSPSYKMYPDDWLHWQRNRDLNDSAIATYVGRGEKLKSLLRCPADNFDGRKTHLAIAPGQGPYLYSYNMNLALGTNVTEFPGARTKITKWRAASRKIMLTEVREDVNTSPVWGYASNLARRHGTAISRGNDIVPAGGTMGINVSAVFLDGHAESVSEDFARNIFHIRPWAE